MLENRVKDYFIYNHWLLCLVCGSIAFLTLRSLYVAVLSPTRNFWSSQPWPGVRIERFARIRAYLRSVTGIRAMAQNGYNLHSKHNRTFAVSVFGGDPWLVLPPSSVKELLEKSDQEIDADIIHNQQIHRGYTQGRNGLHIWANPIQFDVVRRQLTRKLQLLTADVYDELKRGFIDYWGEYREDWKSINVYPICVKIVTRAANRVFAGEQLCRNEDFLEHSKRYSLGLFACAQLIEFVPSILRPVLAPLIVLTNKKNEKVCRSICMPIIKDRLDRTLKRDGTFASEAQPPTDALQWLIEDCVAQNDPKELDPELIFLRLLTMNLIAIHTTSLAITNVILNLYSSPRADEFVQGLRDECDRVLAKHGKWTKEAVNDLVRVDSTIRESMRTTDTVWLAVNRMVTAPNGISFRNNIHVPQGIQICVPAEAIHQDETFYPNASEFDAFRFSRPRESHQALANGTVTANGDSKRSLDLKNTSLVTTADDFYGFGHGRHACPGRFFAAQELKLMLAHLVMHYDVEKMPKRPEDFDIIGFAVPKDDTKIRVRRR